MLQEHLDQIDFQILSLLQKDGSLTYKEIAGKIRRSTTTVVERTKALKENGYIKKTVALVDIQKIRTLMVAYPHIRLNKQSEENIIAFKKEMDKFEEVMECYQITGQYDFMIKIVISNMVSYNEFLRDKIGKLPYVGTIESYLVLSEFKHDTAYRLWCNSKIYNGQEIA